MRTKFIASILAAFMLCTGLALAADSYDVDMAHSTVGFSVAHLVISHVSGRFGNFSGTILYDEKDVKKSSVSGMIKVASIDTANAKRDEHLRGVDFFDAAKFPEITFATTGVVREGDSTVCVGTLTMKGVTREVRIPFTVLGKIKDPWGNTRIAVEANLTINRQDYGVTYSKVLEGGGLMVGDEVKITLAAEAVQKQ